MSEWISVSDRLPEHEVVLMACDSYDCGWVIDTGWWSKDDKCWYATTPSGSEKANMPYSHWMKMPEPPK